MDRILSAIVYPSIEPVIVQLGPLAIRWYGLAYMLGFMLAALTLRRMIRSGRLRLTSEQLAELMTWLIGGVLIGGRAGWWIFYRRADGVAAPWYAPLAIWEGGMSFHGGLAGVALALVAWTALRRAPLWNVADCLALVAPIGLFLGRIANFINAELVGRPTQLPWGVIFPGDTIARHPSQLYEAVLEGPVLFLVLWWFARRHTKRDGHVAGLFMVLYGVVRFAVEFTRQPDEQLGFIAFGWLTMGQLLSLVLVVAGAGILAMRHRVWEQPFRHRSLRVQLLVVVNLFLLAGLVGVLLLDYQRERTARLQEKQRALQNEATVLLPALKQLRGEGLESLQQHLDSVCSRMEEPTSPGHHIAVRAGSSVIEARTHHIESDAAFAAMESGRYAANHRAPLDGKEILVGSATGDDVEVYVSEFVGQVLQSSRNEIFQRSLSIGLLGLMGLVVTDFVLVRVLVRPVDSLVRTVRCIGNGHLGAQTCDFASAELQYLSDEINTMSQSLATAAASQASQMAKARAIQRRLHPSDTETAGWQIASLYQPADDVGGDFFDFQSVGDRLLVVCIADVSGHGIAAAMGAAMLKTLFRTALEQTREPAEIIRLMNRGFLTVSLDTDFASMTVALMDGERQRVRYASAGHEPAYLVHPDGGIRTLAGTGLLLGIEPDAEWEVVEVELDAGEQLVLLTDGWAETIRADGSLIGRSALRFIVSEAAELAPKQLVQRFNAEVRSEAGSGQQADDLTLMVIRCVENHAQVQPITAAALMAGDLNTRI